MRNSRSRSVPVAAVRRLITATVDTDQSPLRSAPAWPRAFQHAGRALADLAQHQHLLATAAGQVVFQHEHAAGSPGPPTAPAVIARLRSAQ